jgi:hypothetical protein
MEDVSGSGGIAPPFLTSAIDGGEWSAPRPGRFTPVEVAPGAHWVGGKVGLRGRLDVIEERKISVLAGSRTLARCYTEWTILAITEDRVVQRKPDVSGKTYSKRWAFSELHSYNAGDRTFHSQRREDPKLGTESFWSFRFIDPLYIRTEIGFYVYVMTR